jgi:NADP-dependent alcohol dehydrogenase
MLNFELYNPTNLVLKGQIEKLSTLVPKGAKNPLAMYGGGSISKMEFTSR